MKKSQRITVAQETLDMVQKGQYTSAAGLKVNISDLVQKAVDNSQWYQPDALLKEFSRAQNRPKAVVEVTEETTLQATQRLFNAGEKDIYCLNFASAKNPGGGFLSGAQAQEESLARSSALYPCLTKYLAMYEYNRSQKTMLYSDHMIYSPQVPVFRNDEGELLDQPYPVSFITSPAINMGALLQNTSYELPLVQEVFQTRLDKILRIALEHGHTTLVLGAWGCGVFANDAGEMGRLFKRFLGPQGIYRTSFKHIVYAVYDRSEWQKIYTPFHDILSEI